MAMIYTTLHVSTASGAITRILRVHICCKLDLMHANNPPAYSAVSYVWGDPTITRTIYVNGAPLIERLNIWKFLLQMRKNSHTGLLWIDAICINQDDVHERGQQVSIMGQIYSNAELVYVWLGSGDPPTEQLIRELNEFNWPSPDLNAFTYESALAPCTLSKTSDVNIFEKLDKSSKLEYWSRTWIVQEFFLARHLRIMYGGLIVRSCLINFDVVMQTVWRSREAYLKRIEPRTRSTSSHFGSFFKSNFRSLLDYSPESRPSSIAMLASNFYSSNCSDPRDHIHALLPLTKTQIACHYTKSTSVLFAEVMDEYLFNVTKNGDLTVSGLRVAFMVQMALDLPDHDPGVYRVLKMISDGRFDDATIGRIRADSAEEAMEAKRPWH